MKVGKGRIIAVGLAFICVVPYLAVQNMKKRTAGLPTKSASASVELSASVPGLKATFTGPGVYITYLDGTTIPADGYGIVVVTKDDKEAEPESLQKAGYKVEATDYPLVIFFNLTAFNPSSKPQVIRRAATGDAVYSVTGGVPSEPHRPVLVNVMGDAQTPVFRIYYLDGSSHDVDVKEWEKRYLGIDEDVELPPQDKLEKMSDAELDKLGLKRGPPAQPEKLKESAPKLQTEKTGLRGLVAKVGGIPAVQPIEVDLVIFKGKVETAERQAMNLSLSLAVGKNAVSVLEKAGKVVAKTRSGADGRYELALPAGVYTMVALVNGKVLGNAREQATWPTVTVGDGWLDYDFRVAP